MNACPFVVRVFLLECDMIVNKQKESPEQLRTLQKHLEYDSESGFFRRKIRTNNRCKSGWFSGCLGSDGYRQIVVSGELHKVHRVAWAIFHGEWPRDRIDHINGDKSDNRISNLRVVTIRENSMNSKLQKNSSSGVNGVCFDRRRSKWKSHIKIESKTKHLGYFSDFDDAVKARKEAEKEYGFHENHGRQR